MIDGSIYREILKELEHLSVGQQRQVLDFALSLPSSQGRLRGTLAGESTEFAGMPPSADAQAMIDAIEKGRNRIDT